MRPRRLYGWRWRSRLYCSVSRFADRALLPTETLLAMLSLPLFVRAIRNAELGVLGQQRAIAMIDLQTAQLQALFGFLMIAGLLWAAWALLPR